MTFYYDFCFVVLIIAKFLSLSLPSESQMEESSNSNVGCNEDNVLVTPYQKQMLLKSKLQPLSIDLPPSSDGDNISVASMYEDSESVSLEENYLDMEEQNMDDGLLWEMDNRSYEELLKELIENEEELRVSDFKLQLLKDEIISLVEDYVQKMIELEKANNMIDYLKAEICSRDDKISNMKKFTDDVKTSLKELIIEVYNLKLGMGELEKEVTRQNGVISDMSEEKKEANQAIRQLH
jgi:hypothetical protein